MARFTHADDDNAPGTGEHVLAGLRKLGIESLNEREYSLSFCAENGLGKAQHIMGGFSVFIHVEYYATNFKKMLGI
jgi:hypothetical protein